jgi:hypothetical protein
VRVAGLKPTFHQAGASAALLTSWSLPVFRARVWLAARMIVISPMAASSDAPTQRLHQLGHGHHSRHPGQRRIRRADPDPGLPTR